MRSTRSSLSKCAVLLLLCLTLALALGSSSKSSKALNLKWNSREITRPNSIARGKINGKIVFTSDRNRSLASRGLRLWSMNADGSNPTELTNDQIPFPPKSSLIDDFSPKWSPDGTKIAFLSYRDFDPDHDPTGYTIYIMDYQGSGVQRVTLDNLRSLSPVLCTEIDSFEWSPDGTKFVLAAGNLLSGIGGCAPKPSNEIYIVNTDGTNLVRLTRDTNPSSSTYFQNKTPTWSPDGRQIAFASWDQNGEGANTIEVMNADGSNRRQIVHYGYQETIKGVSWSPDGSKILFVGPPRYGTCANYICSELYVINPDGSELTQLTHYPAIYGCLCRPQMVTRRNEDSFRAAAN